MPVTASSDGLQNIPFPTRVGPRSLWFELVQTYGVVVGKIQKLFPKDGKKKQTEEEKELFAKVDRVKEFFEDRYREEHKSPMQPNPILRVNKNLKYKIKKLIEEVGLLTSLLFAHLYWEKDDEGNYKNVIWANDRSLGAFVCDGGADELKAHEVVKTAKPSIVRDKFRSYPVNSDETKNYLEGFDDDME